MNPACSSLTGYSEAELLSRPFSDLVHPDDIEMMLQRHAKRLQGDDAPDTYFFRVLTKDAAVKWLRLNAVEASWAGRPAVLGMVTDITEQKRVEEELNGKGTTVPLKIFAASIQDGISVVDKDLTRSSVLIPLWSDGTQAMPLLGKKCFEVYREGSTPCEGCPTLDALHSGQPAYKVVPKSGPDGSIRGWLDLYSFPFMDESTGEIEGVIEYVRDITERKESQDNLEFEHERFQMLAHNAPFGMLMLSANGDFEYVNPKFLQLFGYEICTRYPMAGNGSNSPILMTYIGKR